jgi:RNA polymerase sporulation-specific sigma factor
MVSVFVFGKEMAAMNREMIQRCETDKEYLEKVMLENENLIWFSIRKYIGEPIKLAVHHRIEKDDLLQLGRLALLKAIKRFDPKRGVKFSSFAVTAIVREVRCFLRDKTTVIRPTRSASQLLSKIKQTYVVAVMRKAAGVLQEVHILMQEWDEKRGG